MTRASKAVRPAALAATGLLLAAAAATVQPHPASAVTTATAATATTAATTTATTPRRVLFDNSKGETAGNADWIISTSQPDPLAQNANPGSETSWTGAISAWGVALQKTGNYSLKTLPVGNTITYGTGGALDLANFDEFVLPEPNVRLSDAEKTAVMKFVQNGGGLFLISDHNVSDRNNDGWDSPAVINDLLTTNGVDNTDPFGFSVDLLNIANENPRAIADSTDPVLNGSFGKVTGSIIRNGTTFTLKPADNPSVKGLLYRTGYSGNTGAFFVTSAFGSGRVAIWGDSSPIDDGTGQSGNTLYDGWNDPAGTDAALALNATAWLANSSGTGTGGGTGCTAAQLITNPGFETGSAAGWTETNSGGSSTVHSGGGEPAHTGSYDAWLDGHGATTTDTLSQTVTLPTGCAAYTLSFWLHIDSAASTTTAFDTLTVTANGTTLARYDNTNAATGYQQRTFSLAGYAGRSVTLKFTGTEDYTKQTSFVLDDVNVNVS
ncbi:hydrolase [Kitasatospora sp. NA04385]|uniref:hydrolase n=1 Tax=Kitasatospora sp. NA04385 TaxID=2742135 RepID=UPI001592665C|nr:hydrolase [Kitasatospora sp. NA04385]QKW23055.1 hydrolase [Kitasatospora sp. NA04385]